MQLIGVDLPTPEPVAILEGTDLPTGLVADWRTLYRDLLTNDLLPQGVMEEQRLQIWAKSFIMIMEDLYKKGA